LKRTGNILFLSAVMYIIFSAPISPILSELKAQPDSATIYYSLFSEYYKNRDFNSALPYGWRVLELEPKKFAQWIYYKMEDIFWYMHDSSDISADEKKVFEDSAVSFYDKAIENYPDAKGRFQARKAFVKESWLKAPAEEVIQDYETAVQSDPQVDSYYYHRLGQLYKTASDANPDYKSKALELYDFLEQREPENPQWPKEQESLVDNIDELLQIMKKTWELDKENKSKALKVATTAMKAGAYTDAINALEFLISKEPENPTYLNPLATAYQKTEDLTKAEATFKKLITLEPNKREHYLNLGILYKDKGQLAAARTQYQKASEVGGGWGLPIYYEGLLYEQAARGCTFDFETKMVYQLAVDTYRRAKNMEPGLSQAQERISALSSSVPTQEDYFFRGHKSGQSLPITGSCFGWIGKSITVP
jgi:tetratricopeptide (TPR) repeat protein